LSFAANQDGKGVQLFESGRFKRGTYKMLCDFKVEGRKFCYEETLFLN
jgi:hypothetical protein